ncbi:MAG: response regulator [Victivallales bacterium]|jgi:signal transduction histidine kinase
MKQNILVVDDYEQNLYQLQVLLGGNGYQVFTAANGVDALTKARQNPPDLIISDILMPVMDGFTLCREWKQDERLRNIPFIFYTATYTDDRDREFALRLGAEQFLVKPEEPEVFMRTIREVIQQAESSPVQTDRVRLEAPKQEKGDFLKQYNETLIRKLESKMGQLEQTNRELERDITERKKAEEEKNKLELQLRESQKMQAVGQLAGGISHDFNNLLSVINGYSEMLIRDPDLKAGQRTKVEEIMRAGERASSLTRQLLVFSRRQPMELKIIDVSTIVSGMSKMLRRLVRESIGMTIIGGADLWHIKADPGQIEQVIMNLVVNARDAMLEGGTLIIKTENVKIDETNRTGHHQDIKPGHYVMLSVSDTGCGMDDKVKEHMFEPFFTTKEVGKGTGLGLATVYSIVKQSNGFIDVQSEPGKGAQFRIYFPQAAGEGALNEEQQDMVIIPVGNETILLVEDEESIRMMLQSFLQSIGYSVLSASNGKKALKLAENHKKTIHLLLSDVVMPGMNGYELGNHLKNLLPGIKQLFMSGYTKPSAANEMVKANNNLIQKPLSLHTLGIKLREILDKR